MEFDRPPPAFEEPPCYPCNYNDSYPPRYSCSARTNEVVLSSTIDFDIISRSNSISPIGSSSSSRRASYYSDFGIFAPLPGTPHKFASSFMSVEISPCQRALHPPGNSTRPKIPVYGKGAKIDGLIRLSKTSDWGGIKRIEIKLEGKASSSVLVSGSGFDMGNASQKKMEKIFLEHKQVVWDRNIDKDHPRDLHFELVLPEETNVGDETAPLPPSFSHTVGGLEVLVLYIVHIDVFRSGLRSHQDVSAPFLYFPKSIPAPDTTFFPRLSGMDVKRFGIREEQWSTRYIPRLPTSKSDGASGCSIPGYIVQVAFPKLMTNPAGRPLPVIAIIQTHSSNPSKVCRSDSIIHATNGSSGPALPRVAVRMVKKLVLEGPNGLCKTKEQILGTASLRKGVTEEIESKGESNCPCRKSTEGICDWKSTLLHCLRGGLDHGELSWTVQGIVSVQYAVRVTIYPPTNELDSRGSPMDQPALFEHDEPLMLTTHGPCDVADEPVEDGSTRDMGAPAWRLMSQLR